jgi:hypothetical protein
VGESGSDVEELAYSGRAGEIPHRVHHESPYKTDMINNLRVGSFPRFARSLVDGVVIFTTEPVVPDSRRVRHIELDLLLGGRWQATGIVCHWGPRASGTGETWCSRVEQRPCAGELAAQDWQVV